MEVLNNKDLKKINGGGVGSWFLAGGIIVFLVGVIDGYVSPLSCNN